MRAFFANGVDNMHIPWAVEGLPTLLHLSLFLFFSGLVIFLFNVDQEVFTFVVWWIGLFSMVYGLITVLPLIRHNSPYYTPLSIPAWYLNAGIPYVAFKILASRTSGGYYTYQTWDRCRDLRDRMLGSVEKVAEKTALEQSSEIDVRILGWTISALGDDDSLEKFFQAIPGFFNSKLVKRLERDFLESRLTTFWDVLDGFLDRTFSSNVVSESVRASRLTTCMNAAHAAFGPYPVTKILDKILSGYWNEALQSVEIGHALKLWGHSQDHGLKVRRIVACIVAGARRRDDRWTTLVTEAFGVPDCDLRDSLAHGDSALLCILIHISRQAKSRFGYWWVLAAFTQFDIRNTLPGLQHEFCALWNEIAQEARNIESYGIHVIILREIRHLYIALHQGTDAVPTAFSASTDGLDFILSNPSSYPLCDIASHHPGSTAHVPVPNPRVVPLLTQPGNLPDALPQHSTSGGDTISRQVKEASIIPGTPSPSDTTTRSESGDSSQTPAATSPHSPIHISPSPTNELQPGAVVAALQDLSPAATLSYPIEGTIHDIVAPRSAVTFAAVPDLDPALAQHNVPRFSAPDTGTTNLLPAEATFSDVPDAPQVFGPLATLSSKNEPFSIVSLDLAAVDAIQGYPNTSTSSLTHYISRHISRDGSALHGSEESTIVSPSVSSDSAPPFIRISTTCPTNLVDLPHAQSEVIPHEPGSPSSSPSLIHLQLTSDLNSQIIETTSAQHNTRDVDPSAAIETFRYSLPLAVAESDVATTCQ
jgi:hypothetical protein